MDKLPWLLYESEALALSEIFVPGGIWSCVRQSDACVEDISNAIFMHWHDTQSLLAVSCAMPLGHMVYLYYQKEGGEDGFLGRHPLFEEHWQLMSCRVDDVMPEKLGDVWGEWIDCAHMPSSWNALKSMRVYLGCAKRRRAQGVLVKSIGRRGYSSDVS